jgi:hypothetical protein
MTEPVTKGFVVGQGPLPTVPPPKAPSPDCVVRDPQTTRNCPYSIYCAVCHLDDDPDPDDEP